MLHITKRQRLTAMCGAFIVSAFISTEIAVVFIGIIYAALEGILAYTAYTLASGITLAFFIWFYRRAYQVEVELFTNQGKSSEIKD